MSKDKSKKYISVFCTYFEVASSREAPTQEELELAWNEYRSNKYNDIEVEYISTSDLNADD